MWLVSPIHPSNFTAEVSPGDTAELKLAGSVDAAISNELTRLVGELHAALAAAGLQEVVVDLRTLEPMSAGSFDVLVTCVNEQRRSLHTLSCFATDILANES